MDNAKMMAVSKAFSAAEEKAARAGMAPGTYDVDLTVRVKGSFTVAQDTEKAPTCSIPLLETLAFFIKRAGITRESAKKALVEALHDAILETTKGEGAILAQHPEIAETIKEVQAEVIAKLPKTPVKGAVKASLTVVEV